MTISGYSEITSNEVLVIGAGPAGIASAYYLTQAGISYRVVERSHIIASTWDSLYPSLRLNTTRFFSHLPGKKFPLRWGIFPLGRQYHAYVVDYARQHNFNIQFGVTVHNIHPEAGGWRVESSQGSSWHPAIISATGRFGAPVMPRIPGMDDFKGQLLHARDYLGPEPFANLRVMVIGNGPSGVDIASELGDYAACPVLLSQRTGVVLRPRYPWGLPKHLWIIIGEKLPTFIARPLLKRVLAAEYSRRELAGIKVPPPGVESMAAGGTRGRALINAVRAGKVKSVDGPARFYARDVEVMDGTRYTVDAVIMATGYQPVLYEYFKCEVEKDAHGWPVRLDDLNEFGLRQVRGYPGLYLVGVFYQGKGAMFNFNTEAQTAVEEIKAHLSRLQQGNFLPQHPDRK